MSEALEVLNIEGVVTTASMHRRMMDNEKFRAAAINTSFFESLADV
jgi:biotin carboxylase